MQDCTTQRVKATGTATGDLYYLQNQPLINQDTRKPTFTTLNQENKLQKSPSSKPKANVKHTSESNVVVVKKCFANVTYSSYDDLEYEKLCNEIIFMNVKLSDYSLWHIRLGHTSIEKTRHLPHGRVYKRC